jgi:hypothetical protein
MRCFLAFVLVVTLSSGVSAQSDPVGEKLKPDQRKIWDRMSLDWSKCAVISNQKGKDFYFIAERALQACSTEEQLILEFLREQGVPVRLFLERKLSLKRSLMDEAIK